MSDSDVNAEPSNAANADRPGEYVVVARRYRPQTFEELIGQQHVAKALSGAITTNRVGHAYLFTGARGVGKTSAARILAKALNCESGPAPVPCNGCDICQSVSSGEDVDVLELRLRVVDRKLITVNHTIAFVGPIRLIERQECVDGL